MRDWIIREKGFSKDHITRNGNKFICGNGYMGIRGTLEEYEKEHLPAVNLAGIYDKVGEGWREPLNAPNALYTRIRVDGKVYTLPETAPSKHEQGLDYRHGIVKRTTTWKTGRGEVTIISERFAHYTCPHVLCMQYTIKTNFHAEVEMYTGIDADVWDIHGPHYDKVTFSENEESILAKAVTHEKGETVAVAEQCGVSFFNEQQVEVQEKKILRHISFISEKEKEVIIEKIAAVYTSQDVAAPEKLALDEVKNSFQKGYAVCKKEQIEAWEEHWKTAEVEIEGDKESMEALNYSLYQLQSIAPRHAKSLSIGARGLSGQTYKGAVFWDTEMFMLEYFLYTQPETARTLLKYRIDTLAGAKEKARTYGYQGAFYAWESQEGGYDACTDYNVTDVFTGRPMRTYFKDKQIHISAAVVYGIMRYTDVTGDDSLLKEGGIETILECANFYDSLLLQKVHTKVYELHDVIGPDEYHERVNNNGYTNRMAKFTFEMAAKILQEAEEKTLKRISEAYPVEELVKRYQEDAQKLYLPQPGKDGIVEQFDGYRKLEDVSVETVRSRLLHEKEYWGGAYGVAAHTQVIKQADVVTWMVMFSEEFSQEILQKNLDYYEPRTEHGSSLSACMYALLFCKCGRPERAYPFFLKSAKADLAGGGKEWAGSIYIGGTHPAAAGGAYMTAVSGFGGVVLKNGEVTANPKLPESWKKLKFHIRYQNKLYQITETKDSVKVECLQ